MSSVRVGNLLLRPFLVVILSVVAAVSGAGPARASGTYLCTGYAGCASVGYSNSGYEAASGTSYWGMYPGHNCTNYAAWRLKNNGVDASYLRGQGNAYQWSGVAAGHGVVTDNTPRVGDIAWWASNSEGAGPGGHVAYVEQLGAGFILTSEDNYGADFNWTRRTPGSYYPDGFIHFGGAPTGGDRTSAVGAQVAFAAASASLWAVGDGGAGNTYLGMMAGTSPAVARLPGGGHERAFQANTGYLWVSGDAGTTDLRLGMMAGTSPAIAVSPSGKFMVVFQANTGNLFSFESGVGAHDLGYGMMKGTSPAIVALPTSGYEIAFQANTSYLWTVGAAGGTDHRLGMAAGTSPALSATQGGKQVAFQANTGYLWTVDAGGARDLHLGMRTQTSPAVTALTGGGTEIAFQANTGNLWVTGTAGTSDLELGMMAATSPAATAMVAGFKVAFQANTGSLWTAGTGGGRDQQQAMQVNTSPALG